MITLTPAMLQGIAREIETLGRSGDIQEIRIAPRNGSTALVTLDAGYGQYSFVVNRNGRTVPAGMGERAEAVA